MIRLSALDQLPVFNGSGGTAAVRECIRLAMELEAMGFERFWVAEHHGDPSRACAAPEVLAATIAARTTGMRVGTGCVLLPYTTPLRVAETHRLMEALAPGRIDLGVGRGGGAVGATERYLQATTSAPGAETANLKYANQILQLCDLLQGETAGPSDEHILAVPEAATSPQVWVMGAGTGGAITAATLGLPFAFAQFAHPTPRPDITQIYRDHFIPSRMCSRPAVAIAVRIACAESARDAATLALCTWIPAGVSGNGRSQSWSLPVYPSLDDVRGFRWSPQEQLIVEGHADQLVTGDPPTVASRLRSLGATYGTDDIVVTTTIPSLEERVRAHRLLAEELAMAQ